MKPLVSILIPAHNAGKWIADTLRSAVAQTWDSKEIVVIDDGSTDNTLDIARRFKSEGVRVLSQSNQGAAGARNIALSLCKGEYIQWLDADDLLSPDKISMQMEAIEGCNDKRTLLSSSWGSFHYRPTVAKFTPTSLWNNLSPTEWLLRKMGQNLHMQTATWLVSRELTDAAGPWNTNLLSDDDGEYFCRVLLHAITVRFVPESKVYYRAIGAQRLSYIGFSEQKLKAQLYSMRLHIRYLLSLEDSPMSRAACVFYLQTWFPYFYPNRLDLVEEMQHMVSELGGRLLPPRLSWKYSWIKTLFGWNLAKRAQLFLPRLKWSIIRSCDKAMFILNGREVSI